MNEPTTEAGRHLLYRGEVDAKAVCAVEDEAAGTERKRLLHMEPRTLARLAWELDHPAEEWCGCGHRWTAHSDRGCGAETGNYVYDVWCRCVGIPPKKKVSNA